MDEEPQSKIIKAKSAEQDLDLAEQLDMSGFTEADTGLTDKKVLSATDLELSIKGREILAKVHREAQAIMDRAKQLYLKVEDKVREAKAQGFAEGREEGLASVTELLVQVRAENLQRATSYEHEAVKLVFELARKIIGDSFQMSEDSLIAMIRQVLSQSTGSELVVLLHPNDFERVKKEQSRLMTELHGSQKLSLRPAETVKPNSCIVESDLCSIEADLDTQLAVLKTVLGIEEIPPTHLIKGGAEGGGILSRDKTS